MADLKDIIDDAHRDVTFGTVFIAIKKHEGKVASIDSNQVVNHSTPKGNVDALATIGSLMKGISASLKQSPSKTPVTATITLFYDNDGNVKRLQVNGFKRKTLD